MECKPTITQHVTMDTSLRMLFPYHGYDTMYFLYNTTDTVFFWSDSVSGMTRSEDDYSPGAVCGPDNVWIGDGSTILFASPAYRSKLRINYSCARDPQKAVLEILFKSSEFPFKADSYELQIKNTKPLLVSGKYLKDYTTITDRVGNKAFYSTLYGLVRLEYTDGEVWDRILK